MRLRDKIRLSTIALELGVVGLCCLAFYAGKLDERCEIGWERLMGGSGKAEASECAAESGLSHEVLVVAETIWREARGESYEGRKAVASVIHNRMHERGMSAYEVVLQRKQFSCWNGREHEIGEDFAAIHGADSVWRECVGLAKAVCDGSLIPSVTANHYYNPRLSNPSWGVAMKSVVVIGRHRFGRV